MKPCLAIIALLLLAGCNTTGTQTAPRVIVAPTGKATSAELAAKEAVVAELQAQANTQKDLAQRAAGAVYGATEANTRNPDGLPKEATAAQLTEAASALPEATAEQKLTKVEQNARILSGELVAVKAEMGQAIGENQALKANLFAAEQRMMGLVRELNATKAAGEKERAEAAAALQGQFNDMSRRITAAQEETNRVRDEERKSMLRKLGYVLLGLGAALTLAGAGIAFVTKGLEWQRAAIAATFGGFCFALYWSMQQWFFKWLVIAVVACAIGAAIWWLLKERQSATRNKEADEAEETLKRIIGSVDKLGDNATVSQVRAAMSTGMNDNHKALIHELRAETKRLTSISP